MTNVRMYYDGGLDQAAGVATIEFDLDGRRNRFELTRSQREAVDPLLGSHEAPAVLGGVMRRRVGESDPDRP
jgi:hypothetical protein